jgi:hypothetical protein
MRPGYTDKNLVFDAALDILYAARVTENWFLVAPNFQYFSDFYQRTVSASSPNVQKIANKRATLGAAGRGRLVLPFPPRCANFVAGEIFGVAGPNILNRTAPGRR